MRLADALVFFFIVVVLPLLWWIKIYIHIKSNNAFSNTNWCFMFYAICGKTEKVAPESVIMKLVSSKCLQVLLYATERLSLFVARSQLNIFCHDSCFDENFQYQIPGYYWTLSAYVWHVASCTSGVYEKSETSVAFQTENLICSLFVSNALNKIAFICNKYSANKTNIYEHI